MTGEDTGEQIADSGPQSDQQDGETSTVRPEATGVPAVDQALASLNGLESSPLAEHHDRLAHVHEELHRVLQADDESGA